MVEGVNSSMIYYKNFYKCHNVPPSSATTKGDWEREREYKTFSLEILGEYSIDGQVKNT
jgi:hypothetical protein